MDNFKRDYNKISFDQYQQWDMSILNLLERLQDILKSKSVYLTENEIQNVLEISDAQLYEVPEQVQHYLQSEYNKDNFEGLCKEIRQQLHLN